MCALVTGIFQKKTIKIHNPAAFVGEHSSHDNEKDVFTRGMTDKMKELAYYVRESEVIHYCVTYIT